MKAALVGLAALALAGCGGGGGRSTSTAAAPTEAQIVQRTQTATAALKSFHFVYAVKNPPAGGSGLVLTSADGDVLVPGRLKANVSGTYSRVPLSSQVVFAGGKAYLKNPLSGAWESFRTSASPIGYFDPSKGVLAVIRTSHTLRLDGSATVGGVDSYRLHGPMPATNVAGFLITKPGAQQVQVDLYVGKSDYRLRRVVVTGPVNAAEPKGIQRVITLSRFDEPVTVTAPKG
jgi:hypothetical protein